MAKFMLIKIGFMAEITDADAPREAPQEIRRRRHHVG